MVEANNAINNIVGASISGVTNTLTVTNASNTASSAARSTITVGGGSAADPTLNFNVGGVTDWEMGIDNNDSDELKISQGTSLGTNDTWTMTTLGERNLPLQPCFSARVSASVANATGDGTKYQIIFNATDINAGSGLNTGTGIFTAPVSGNYLFAMVAVVDNLSSSHTGGFGNIETSNRTFTCLLMDPFAVKYAQGMAYNGTCIAPMDAADTAFVNVEVDSGPKTVTVRGGGLPRCNFYGFLLS